MVEECSLNDCVLLSLFAPSSPPAAAAVKAVTHKPILTANKVGGRHCRLVCLGINCEKHRLTILGQM